MEKIYLARLKNVIFASPNFPRHQSGFRPGHSTETALLKVFDDLVSNAEKQYATLLLSLPRVHKLLLLLLLLNQNPSM